MRAPLVVSIATAKVAPGQAVSPGVDLFFNCLRILLEDALDRFSLIGNEMKIVFGVSPVDSDGDVGI